MISTIHDYFDRYPTAGYGETFFRWAALREREPYNSWGNGSAMRVGAIGFAMDTLEEVLREAERSAAITHIHEEGIRGAQATAAAIFLARTGTGKPGIKSYVESQFGYDLNRRLDDIQPGYTFDVSCQGSVPESIIAFLEGEDYEDTIRNAISLGGDADTMACIAGGIAEAFWGVPEDIEQQALARLDDGLLEVIRAFNARFRAQP
ncbi:MAG: ADP-ribosylglycohydrolase family protein [Pseudomonadota bacterium]